MRLLLALMGISLGVMSSVAANAAPVDIGAGIEMFNWQELDTSGGSALKESGPRLFLRFEGENRVSERWTYGFRSRFYSGSINCSGVLKNGSSCVGGSDYDGLMVNADFTGRFRREMGDYSDWGLRLGIGGEVWRRHHDGVTGYTENYSTIVGRLGVALIPEHGWFGEGGLKYPFTVNEKITLGDGARLTPQGAFSLFALVGYNLSQRWSIRGYYDSYRFKASDSVALTSGGAPVGSVTQAKSDVRMIGISAGFYF